MFPRLKEMKGLNEFGSDRNFRTVQRTKGLGKHARGLEKILIEADWDRTSSSANQNQEPGNSNVYPTWPPIQNTAFNLLLFCAKIKIIHRKKVRSIRKNATVPS